ncbi:MAG: ornithine cyclodeaminase family protein [Candidatus Methanomethyliaceae archaeon]|nr:ornithine cyclodeaminase family protein [Candidatus Methanomethyliaceae archaeon]
MTLLLDKDVLRKSLPMKEAISAVEEGFRLSKTALVPQRIPLKIERHNAVFLYMPAYVGGMDALVVKEVSVHPDNPKKGLPTVQGTILLNDPSSGSLLAILEGGSLTAIRTGATTGVATKYLSRRDATNLGIFGCGVQARTQLEAIACVRRIHKAKVYDINATAAKKFAFEMSELLGIDVKIANSPRDVLEGMDIIVTATTSKIPVFSGEWIAPGTHINGIGSHTPDARELDTETIRRSRVIVDSREACLEEAGDIIIPINEGAITVDHIKADLGEVVRGECDARTSDEEVTVFKSVGLALEDAVVALRAYIIARDKGLGKIIEL